MSVEALTSSMDCLRRSPQHEKKAPMMSWSVAGARGFAGGWSRNQRIAGGVSRTLGQIREIMQNAERGYNECDMRPNCSKSHWLMSSEKRDSRLKSLQAKTKDEVAADRDDAL